MTAISKKWYTLSASPENDDIPIRQVYVWLLTRDGYVVIVSKDGESWQLPGGKPAAGEGPIHTAVREVREETGVDISHVQQGIIFFGEYRINDSSEGSPLQYRQIRAYLRLAEEASGLALSAAGESVAQDVSDVVYYVKAVPVLDITKHISWMAEAEEYRYLQRHSII